MSWETETLKINQADLRKDQIELGKRKEETSRVAQW